MVDEFGTVPNGAWGEVARGIRRLAARSRAMGQLPAPRVRARGRVAQVARVKEYFANVCEEARCSLLAT
jgi:hypothetical protein